MERTDAGSVSRAAFSLAHSGCLSSSAVVENRLRKLKGIGDAQVIYSMDSVLVEYNPSHVSEEEILSFLGRLRNNAGKTA